ncbi:hypothetical protein GCM10027428_30730 [Haliea atlantica]
MPVYRAAVHQQARGFVDDHQAVIPVDDVQWAHRRPVSVSTQNVPASSNQVWPRSRGAQYTPVPGAASADGPIVRLPGGGSLSTLWVRRFCQITVKEVRL